MGQTERRYGAQKALCLRSESEPVVYSSLDADTIVHGHVVRTVHGGNIPLQRVFNKGFGLRREAIQRAADADAQERPDGVGFVFVEVVERSDSVIVYLNRKV